MEVYFHSFSAWALMGVDVKAGVKFVNVSGHTKLAKPPVLLQKFSKSGCIDWVHYSESKDWFVKAVLPYFRTRMFIVVFIKARDSSLSSG
jgi:hypothetical protein